MAIGKEKILAGRKAVDAYRIRGRQMIANKQVLDRNGHTPWDVSTATYDNKSGYVGEQASYPYDVSFKPDGTKMYIMDEDGYTVYQYSLSTAWDVSTATYEDKSKDVGDEETSPYGVFFKPDGIKMYIVGYANETVYQYSLSTAWDVSTATYEDREKYVGDQDSYPYGVFFKPDGTKMYIMGYDGYTVFQYSLPPYPHSYGFIIGQKQHSPQGG